MLENSDNKLDGRISVKSGRSGKSKRSTGSIKSKVERTASMKKSDKSPDERSAND